MSDLFDRYLICKERNNDIFINSKQHQLASTKNKTPLFSKILTSFNQKKNPLLFSKTKALELVQMHSILFHFLQFKTSGDG